MLVNQSFGTENFTEMAIGSKTFAMGQTATISYADLFGLFNFPEIRFANIYFCYLAKYYNYFIT